VSRDRRDDHHVARGDHHGPGGHQQLLTVRPAS
jgi:hypothetical protein